MERCLLGLLLGGIALGCILVLWPFFSCILWAAILVFTTWPVYERLRVNLKLRRAGAAGVMVALTAVVIVLPLALAAPTSGEDVAHLRNLAEGLMRGGLPAAPVWARTVPVLGVWVASIWDHWAADLSALGEVVRPYLGLLIEGGFSLLLGLVNGVVLCALSLFIAFFVYLHGAILAAKLEGIVRRVAGGPAERLIAVTGAMIRGTVYSILGTAILQGVLTWFGLWVAGVPRAVTLGVIVAFLSVLPIGAPVIWVPAALWLLTIGRTGAGIFLFGYGLVVITGTYYVVQPWLVARGAQLPFLLTALGVIGGALAFGLLGIFLGPVLLGVGYTLANEWISPARPALLRAHEEMKPHDLP
ncbi:MAG: AI-2E family transporter [Acetobacteraceae bacterium]|nr:AI-2E family transporter [Acetobacteraceae bacterium]